ERLRDAEIASQLLLVLLVESEDLQKVLVVVGGGDVLPACTGLVHLLRGEHGHRQECGDRRWECHLLELRRTAAVPGILLPASEVDVDAVEEVLPGTGVLE